MPQLAIVDTREGIDLLPANRTAEARTWTPTSG